MKDRMPLVASTLIQPSAFHEATYRAGCRSYAVEHYSVSYVCGYPGNIHDPEEEYWNLVRNVVLFDPPVERPIEVIGPDALKFVDYVFARDMTKCPVGRCRYTVFVDAEGRMLADTVVLRLAEDRYWMSGDLGWMKGLAAGTGMDVRVFLADVAPVQVQGPKSVNVMQDMFGSAVTDLAFYELAQIEFRGMPLVVTRTGWTGERGYEVYLADVSRATELWDAIMEAGAPHGIMATGTSEARRVEAGIVGVGLAIGPAHNPFEVGLDHLVSFKKESDYVGREALARIKAEGVSRKIVGYSTPERLDAALYEFPWDVKAAGEKVGEATIAVWSPGLEKTIGFAMAPIGFTEPGTRLTLAAPAGDVDIEVCETPFVDPQKTRMRS